MYSVIHNSETDSIELRKEGVPIIQITKSNNIKVHDMDLHINGNFTVNGLTTFSDSMTTTMEDTNLHMGVADTVYIAVITIDGRVRTMREHGFSNGEYVIFQGTEKLNGLYKIFNVSPITFDVALPHKEEIEVDEYTCVGRVITEQDIDGGGITLQSHRDGKHAPKHITYDLERDAWKTNIGIDAPSVSLNGTPVLGDAGTYHTISGTITVDHKKNFVGVNASPPQCELDVGGTCRAADIVTLADKRFVTNIEPIDKPERVLDLQGVSFGWRHLPALRNVGLVAQDVEGVCPELVMTDSEGYKSVRYDKLCVMLLEQVKALSDEVSKLKK